MIMTLTSAFDEVKVKCVHCEFQSPYHVHAVDVFSCFLHGRPKKLTSFYYLAEQAVVPQCVQW